MKEKKIRKIFVTGGAGYIGSHCVISLIKEGFLPIIIDNFSNSYPSVIKKIELIIKKKIIFYNIDLKNKKKLNKIFKKHNCYSVIHCAGYKAVGESIVKPISYFENNIGSTLSLLECMNENNVHKIIFSSSAVVYNEGQTIYLNENRKIGKTINPYGNSKYIIERILKDIAKHNKKWNISIARYFNPISNHPSGLIKENPKGIPNNLIPILIKVAQKKIPLLKVFGKNYNTKDGTCVRDYIHVMDLANGHISILKNTVNKNGFNVFNFGTGRGSTVLEVINAFERQTGKSITYKFSKRRDGDVTHSVCSPKKAIRELKWKAKYDLDQSMFDIKNII